MEMETISMNIIANAGDARSMAFKAIDAMMKQEYETCNQLLADAEAAMYKAHEFQTDILVAESRGEEIKGGVLLVHAQDWLMTSMLVVDLVKKFVQYDQMRTEVKV